MSTFGLSVLKVAVPMTGAAVGLTVADHGIRTGRDATGAAGLQSDIATLAGAGGALVATSRAITNIQAAKSVTGVKVGGSIGIAALAGAAMLHVASAK